MLCHVGLAGLHCASGCELPRPGLLWSVPTRLETRTKESNMSASIRVVNPDAQRNQDEGLRKDAPQAAPDLL